MVIYILLIVILVFQGNTIHNRNVYAWITFLELLLVAGLRLPVLGKGSDTEFYCDLYVSLSNSSISGIISTFRFETGFYLFCTFLTRISKNPQLLIFTTQALMSGIVVYVINKKSHIPWFSTVLYITLMYFFSSMNLMRYSIACSILFLSIDYIIRRKLLRFALLVLIAAQFHFSAYIFLLSYFIYPLRLNKKNLFAIFVPFVIVFYSFMTFFQFLISFNSRYGSYQTDGEFAQSAFGNILIFAVNFLFLMFVSFKSTQHLKDLNEENKFYYQAMMLGTLFSALAINVMIVGRFAAMFSIFSIIFIPNVIRTLPHYLRSKYIILMLIGSVAQVVVILTYRPEWYLVTPYRNFLFE